MRVCGVKDFIPTLVRFILVTPNELINDIGKVAGSHDVFVAKFTLEAMKLNRAP
jgi:hypothetical protein